MKEIWTYDGSLQEAFCPQSVTLVLEHDLDISRGDMIIGLDNLPGMSADLTSTSRRTRRACAVRHASHARPCHGAAHAVAARPSNAEEARQPGRP